MSKPFDRLEKLFAYRRKGSLPAAPTRDSPSPTNRYADIEQQFPSPSFIRPKALRMSARDEVRLRDTTCRSPSVPDIFTCHASIRSHSCNDASTASSCLNASAPSPSLSCQRQDGLEASFARFSFTKPTRTNGRASPHSPATKCDPPRIPSPRSGSPLHMDVPAFRSDTPPSSDPEDTIIRFAEPWKTKKLPDLPLHALPTPCQSPQLEAVPELCHSRSVASLHRYMPNDIAMDLVGALQIAARRPNSEGSFASSSSNSSVLREPDVNEFLSLTDDDIAEDITEDAQDDLLHADPDSILSKPSKETIRPLSTALLTLTPPYISQPATAAAFEAARIARRYDFDLIYVVNLWPGQMVKTHGERPLIGRLLAAHGLHHVPSPLQISSLVHTTILRSDGWIEYRNADAKPLDLARGYATAFYTGQYSPSLSGNRCTPVSGVRLSEQIDRGIVFAAYRKPRPGQDRLGHSFNDEQLCELHREAESLVEMLVDIHTATRMRQSPTYSRAAHETGPMPVQHVVAA